MPPLKAGPLERGLGSSSDMAWCCSAKYDAQKLGLCMHFFENLAQKRDSAMACQSHAIAHLERGVRGGPWKRFAKNAPDWNGQQNPMF